MPTVPSLWCNHASVENGMSNQDETSLVSSWKNRKSFMWEIANCWCAKGNDSESGHELLQSSSCLLFFLQGSCLSFHPKGPQKNLCWKGESGGPFFSREKKIIKPSISLHPPLIRPSINRVRVKLGHPQQVGNHKTSPTSIKAQRSTRLEKLS